MTPNIHAEIRAVVASALREDLGHELSNGDLTADLIPPDNTARAGVVAREAATLCGSAWFEEVFRQLSPGIRINWLARDGESVQAGKNLCDLSGPTRALLSGERTALNFLQTLSATATATTAYVNRIQGTGASVLDTRKTLPGLRHAQKYAVACGGGVNHRQGLYDGILIKENHIAAAGSIRVAVESARSLHAGIPVEVEVETLGQVTEALNARAELLLLDNFSIEMLKDAVRATAAHPHENVLLEASGDITLENIRAIAETGVDRISIGGLTKHVRAVDLSMRFQE